MVNHEFKGANNKMLYVVSKGWDIPDADKARYLRLLNENPNTACMLVLYYETKNPNLPVVHKKHFKNYVDLDEAISQIKYSIANDEEIFDNATFYINRTGLHPKVLFKMLLDL